jgi:hypothetical protein
VSYLANVMDKLENTLEATTCESLLVDRNELLAGASQIPEGRDRCGGFVFGREKGGATLAAGGTSFGRQQAVCSATANMSCAADLDFFYQCGAFTAPLVKSNQLVMALNSWVLDTVSSGAWDPNSASMLRFHESHKHSAEVYNQIITPIIVPVSESERHAYSWHPATQAVLLSRTSGLTAGHGFVACRKCTAS